MRIVITLATVLALSSCGPFDQNSGVIQIDADRCRGKFALARSAADSVRVIRESYNDFCGGIVGADLRVRAKEGR